MEQQAYTLFLSQARDALRERHLLSAIRNLQSAATHLKAYEIKNVIGGLMVSYGMQLDHVCSGGNDPGRDEMYSEFTRYTAVLCDTLEREAELQDATSFYTTTYRTLQQLLGGTYSLTAALQNAKEGRDVFDAVWVSGPWTQKEVEAVNEWMRSDDHIVFHKCLLLSAAMLSAMRFYDAAKLRLLLNYIDHADTLLRARAVVGMVLVHMCHPDRISEYPDLKSRMLEWTKTLRSTNDILLMQAAMYQSLEAKRIESKLCDDMVPDILKELKNGGFANLAELTDTGDPFGHLDLDPNLAKDERTARLIGNIKEFLDMQDSGIDSTFGPFRRIFPQYPFFQTAANWFYPFTLNHPQLPKVAVENPLDELFPTERETCDVHEYLKILVVARSPGDFSIKAKLKEFKEKLMGMKEAMKELPLPEMKEKGAARTYSEEVRAYIFGCYRFFELYPHREAFVNPFKLNLYLSDYPLLDLVIGDIVCIWDLAELCVENRAYEAAIPLLKLYPQEDEEYLTCRKLGYCYDQLGNAAEAADWYALADRLYEFDERTTRRLAVCMRRTGRYEEAVKAYEKLEAEGIEDITLMLCRADCLIHLKRYEEALKYLFKANYLSGDTPGTIRPLAWCLLLSGKYDRAEQYYQKLFAAEPAKTDYLNAGHNAWLMGNTAEAVARYLRALPEDSTPDFLAQDSEMLHKAGLTDCDLAIMTDAVLSRRG